MSRSLRAAAFAGTAVLCVTLCACSNGSGGGTVATVNGQAISRADLDHRLESSPAAKQVLSQLVQQAMIDQYARDKKIDVTQDDIKKKEDDVKSKMQPGQFEQAVKTQGLTDADLSQIFRQQIILDRAVAPQIHVSDADVKAYFDKNHAAFDKPAQVRARHIVVADQKTANDVLAKLKAPNADWTAIAKQYSTDPGTKEKGGELGFFGKGQMVPQFDSVAFSAKIGQVVGPVKSPFGFHIIQVEERKPATKATFASTKDQIRTQLEQQQKGTQYPAFMQQLRANAKIDVSDDRYKDVFPPVVATPAAGAAPATGAAAPATAAPAPSPAPAST